MPRTQSWIKTQIRGSNPNGNTTTRAGAPLNPAGFTAHMCTKPGELTMVAPKHFTVDEISRRARLADFRTGLRQGATEYIMRC